MTPKEYSDIISQLDLYPVHHRLECYILGINEEAGELAGKRKKLIRDGYGPDIRTQMILELGDIMWYNSRLATFLGTTLEEVMDMNVAKLKSRQARGTLRGSGDDR